jgi:hypothetical protein
MRRARWRGAISVDQVMRVDAAKGDGVAVHQAVARELDVRAKVNAELLDQRLRYVRLRLASHFRRSSSERRRPFSNGSSG